MATEASLRSLMLREDVSQTQRAQPTIAQAKYMVEVICNHACTPPAYSTRSQTRRAAAMRHFTICSRSVCLFVSLSLLLIGHGWAQKPADGLVNLMRQLKDGDADLRAKAAEALGEMGEEAKEAIPALIAALKDTETRVRASAATALGKMGAKAKEAIPALIAALKDTEAPVRYTAAFALRSIGEEAKEAIPALIAALKDTESLVVRATAAFALGKMGAEAKEAIPALIAALKDTNADVRAMAAFALIGMGKWAKEAIPALIVALKDTNADVRASAAITLQSIGAEAKEAIPALIAALKDTETRVRASAATALGKMGAEAKEVIPALIAALKDTDASVRASAAAALGKMGAEAKEVIPALIAALKDTDASVRTSAAAALGEMRAETKEVIPALIAALKDTDASVSTSAAQALGLLAAELFDAKHTEMLPQLKHSYDALKAHLDPDVRQHALIVKRTIDYFESLWWSARWVRQHPYISSGVATYLFLPLVWLLLLWIRPQWLLPISAYLTRYEPKFKMLNAEINIPLRHFLLLGLFNYHRRVLDAWVQMYLPTARKRFAGKRNVEQHQVYVDISAKIKRPNVEETGCNPLTAAELQPDFSERTVRVLVTGEGGAGKTSLACRLAMWAMDDQPERRLCKEHPMLPVLIDGDLQSRTDNKDAFVERIRGLLRELIGETEVVYEELLLQLLRKGRVLVIVDRFSEWPLEIQKLVDPSQSEFPVATLIVTSRDEKLMNDVSLTIKPDLLQGHRLAEFIEKYIAQCGKSALFGEVEQLNASAEVAKMKASLNVSHEVGEQFGQREITVLITRLYADEMIAEKEQRSAKGMPKNIPDLMLRALNTLTSGSKDKQPGDPDDPTMRRAAQIVAWKCLEPTYVPSDAQRSAVLEALREEARKLEEQRSKGKDIEPHGTQETVLHYPPENRLRIINTTESARGQTSFSLNPLAEYQGREDAVLSYLEKRLRLIQIVGVNEDRIRFSIDPLAEYLAALHLVERYGSREELWNEFFARANEQPGAPEAIRGFLRAVRDCCIEKGSECCVPDKIKDELAKLAGLDVEVIKAAQQRQRVHLLLAPLNSPEADDRIAVLKQLWSMGLDQKIDAKVVLPALIRAVQDEDVIVQRHAAMVIGEIGPEAKAAVPVLIEELKNWGSPASSYIQDALRKIGVEALPGLTEALEHEDPYLQREVAQVLCSLGATAAAVLPMLRRKLQDQNEITQYWFKRALQRIESEIKSKGAAQGEG